MLYEELSGGTVEVIVVLRDALIQINESIYPYKVLSLGNSFLCRMVVFCVLHPWKNFWQKISKHIFHYADTVVKPEKCQPEAQVLCNNYDKFG